MLIYGKERKSETDLEIGKIKKAPTVFAKQRKEQKQGKQNNKKKKKERNSRTSREIERKGKYINTTCGGK